MLPQIRELKCKRCGARQLQRMTERGGFDKIKKCPKCGAENSMATLRIMTHMPG